MSLSERQAHAFFSPLKGKTVTIVLNDRAANLTFARATVGLLAAAGGGCVVLDLDAFYSSNSESIFGPLPSTSTNSFLIMMPRPESEVEEDFSKLFGVGTDVTIVDSLNSLYHLLSGEDGVYRGRKLSFAVAALSYAARVGGRTAMFVMYRREGFSRRGAGRSISSLSDVTVEVEASGQELIFKCERGTAWPGGRFSIRSPSEPRAVSR